MFHLNEIQTLSMGVDQSVELAAQPGYWPKGTLQLLPPWLQSATGGRDLYLSNARADLREKKVSSSLPALLPIFFFGLLPSTPLLFVRVRIQMEQAKQSVTRRAQI